VGLGPISYLTMPSHLLIMALLKIFEYLRNSSLWKRGSCRYFLFDERS